MMNWKSKYNKDELLKEGLITQQEYETWDDEEVKPFEIKDEYIRVT